MRKRACISGFGGRSLHPWKGGAAFTLFVFYLGRLSGRDDSTDWNKVALGRVAELKDKARSDLLFSSCMDFYISKIQ